MARVELPQKWDHEADVIIVGGGTSGLPAAIVVAEAGLRATILESRPQCGGSLGMVAAGMAFAGTEEQKAEGVEDSPDIYYEDMINVAGADPELARAFVDNQLDAYKMLKEEGIAWPFILWPPGQNRRRGLVCTGLGPKMVKALKERAERQGVDILLRHRAIRLFTDLQTGSVIGLEVSFKDGTKNIKARRAVIIASGGFGRNREMIIEYAPEMVDAVPKMPVSHLGDGLKMGLQLGAATKDVGKAVAPAWPLCTETHSNALWIIFWGGILVNVNGKRFHDESCVEGYYGPMTGAGMKQPGGVYWAIFDNGTKEALIKGSPQNWNADVEKCKQYKADTIEELASIAGIDTRGLKETVDKYNGDLDNVGYDTLYNRTIQQEMPLIKLDTPPFYAIRCTTATTSMKGGLKINRRCQVIDQFGEVITRLYAAGEVTGGLHSKSYLLGVMSTGALTQGVIAGRSAIEESSWQ